MGSLDLTYGILEPGKIAGALHTAMRQLRQQAKTHSECDFYLTITVVLASNFNPELPADTVLPITLDLQDLHGSFASAFDLVRRQVEEYVKKPGDYTELSMSLTYLLAVLMDCRKSIAGD